MCGCGGCRAGCGCVWLGYAAAAAAQTAPTKLKPVEPDMHEFMEYVFQPTFRRLHAAMSAIPENNNGWKAIKADALILAEGGNLLLMRSPDDKEQAATWNGHSVTVRDFGGQLYQAAKKKDFVGARKRYVAMVQSCNACHIDFAGGKHQLKP